jgi:CheY-like chemotaxis protein
MESDLRQGQKLQALGELAGGIAHDFNNVLQAVMGGMRLIEKHANEPSALRRYAGQIMSSVERGAAITQRLLLLARRSDLTPQAVRVAALFDELKAVLGPTLGPTVTVRTDVPPGLPAALADKAQLETALINLATNARDAMPAGGTVMLSATAEPQGLGGGPWIRISVRDTGVGMDAATLARATEPFFSTKPPGKGTGLGVPMAKGFAEQSGGHLAIESEPGRGTTVTLWLPQAAAEDEAETPEVKPPPPGSERRPLRLLLVDDDAAVLATLSAELAAGGSTVLTAESGEEAIARLERGAVVDALVTDLSMPGMDGLTVIREARGRVPGLPAVLLTGYPGDPAQLLAAGRETGPFALLSKPSTGDRIAEALATITQGRARTS